MGALKDLEKFRAKFSAGVTNALEREVADVVKQEMTNQIFINVYDKYEPTMYKRRYSDGGLVDERNMTAVVTGNKLVVRNETRDTGHMLPIITENADGGDVVSVVERGTGYTWEYSKIYHMQPFPRPFHKPTEDTVIAQGTAKRALKNGLSRQGFLVK